MIKKKKKARLLELGCQQVEREDLYRNIFSPAVQV